MDEIRVALEQYLMRFTGQDCILVFPSIFEWIRPIRFCDKFQHPHRSGFKSLVNQLNGHRNRPAYLSRIHVNEW